ncbi:GNAT family N-acetyltransferase [Nocardiopsis sp. MG754419]|uniref:GNAT family N-acetyltransferase n=1 Tax=Nocardiopsis sp. MG754419 TaxID=2259865 RepID=UPI001BA48A50|nr:GNAT family N-acetyltransferase [Nocardiopsis sp. MG754419]MBR8745114.1 GNAT family N-acetyltransferase [Nocardiopsis sp. MG754419]
MTSTTAAGVTSTRTATMDDVPAIARVLGRAFHDDPLFRWFFPDDATRMARSVRLNALTAGFDHVPRGDAEVCEVLEDGRRVVRAAAMWNPPTAGGQSAANMLRTLPHWASMVGVRRLTGMLRFFAELRLSAPQEPHLHLEALGADPVARGLGAGASLLRAGLERADADGVPVYLETMNPANIGYYEKHGFHVLRALNDPEFPSTYALLRPTS